MTSANQTAEDVVEIAGRHFTIERVRAFGDLFYACSIFPMRRNREDLIRYIELSQGPEWRGVANAE
jgi:hypothetical protein